jgi:8-oxo-dGTP diphosphatase
MNFPHGLKRAAAMIVLRNEDSFLLLKRIKPPHPGKYVPVGGKLDPHEDPHSAAVRELREETGLQIDQLKYCGHLVESSPVAYNWQCHIYLADIPHMAPPPCDEGSLEWISFEELDSVPTPPTDACIYQFIREGRIFALNAIYDQDLNLIRMEEEIRGERVM